MKKYLEHKNKILVINDSFRCIDGAGRSVLLDNHKNSCVFVPLTFSSFCKETQNKSLAFIYDLFNTDSLHIVDSYIDFVLDNGFGMLCNPEHQITVPDFEKRDIYLSPFEVSNAIICRDKFGLSILKNLIAQLENLGCRFLELKLDCSLDEAVFVLISDALQNRSFKNIDITGRYHPSCDNFNFERYLIENINIGRIEIFSAPINRADSFFENLSQVEWSETDLLGNKYCGAVKPEYFASNFMHYREAINHNTCLNRKIAIDIDGNIKNCPSMTESFGNIKDTTLAEAIEKPGFKKYWNITKDQIAVCKDCEFRYICTDCRAYLENPEDIYSKPLKCGYNPYTCEWEEWSTNPLKQQAIEYYGFNHVKN